LYSSPNVIRIIKDGERCGACSRNGEKINAYRILVGKPEGKRQLLKPRLRILYELPCKKKLVVWCDKAVWTRMKCIVI
jgi:uncharacterized protein (DUF302 family)